MNADAGLTVALLAGGAALQALQVDGSYCDFVIRAPGGAPICTLYGYAANVRILAAAGDQPPVLVVGNAYVSLPTEASALSRLAEYVGIPCPMPEAT